MTYELSTLAPLPGLTFDLANGCEPRRAAASLWVPLNYSSASCQQRLITVVGSENMACNRGLIWHSSSPHVPDLALLSK